MASETGEVIRAESRRESLKSHRQMGKMNQPSPGTGLSDEGEAAEGEDHGDTAGCWCAESQNPQSGGDRFQEQQLRSLSIHVCQLCMHATKRLT